VRRDNGCGTTVKGNDDVGWCSNYVVLWLRKRQNRDTIEWWESDQDLDNLFIPMEGESRVVREGSMRRRCRFNTSVSTLEVKRRDKALLEDEVEVACSS
jgi:hypothetical protein